MSWADIPQELYDRQESYAVETWALHGLSARGMDWRFAPTSELPAKDEELIPWP